MKSKLFFTAALPLMAAALTLVFTGCSNDDDIVPESREGQTVDEGYAIFSTGTPGTRTTVGQIPMDKDGNVTGPLPFYWTNGDYIYVKDDNGVWRKSEPLDIPHYSWGWPTASFKVPGTFSPDKLHEVRYTGCAKYNVGVNFGFIRPDLSQFDPKRGPIFTDSDCGVDTAKWANGHYTFRLQHKLSYLCILPYSTNRFARDFYHLRYVTIKSDNPISGTFIFDGKGGVCSDRPTVKNYMEMTFHTDNGTGVSRTEGTWIRTSKPDPRCTAFYVSILPGKHKLILNYHQELWMGQLEGYMNDTEQVLEEFDYEPGRVYTLTIDLKAPEHPVVVPHD